MTTKRSLFIFLPVLTATSLLLPAAVSYAPGKKKAAVLPCVLNAKIKSYLYTYQTAANKLEGTFLRNLLETRKHTVKEDNTEDAHSSPCSSFALSGDGLTFAYADERHINVAKCVNSRACDHDDPQWRCETALYPDTMSKGTIEGVALSRRGSTLYVNSCHGKMYQYKKVGNDYLPKCAAPDAHQQIIPDFAASYPRSLEVEHTPGSPVSLSSTKIETGLLARLLSSAPLEQLNFLSSINYLTHHYPDSWILLNAEQVALFRTLPADIKAVLRQWSNITTKALYNTLVARRRQTRTACLIS